MKKQYKVLLVDDSEDIRSLLRFVFENQGFEVEEAEDGLDASNKALETFDAILLDLQMPNMDGKQFLHFLRNDRSLEIPVIMFTSHEKEGLADSLLEVGANKVLIKPERSEVIVQQVLDLIEAQ